MRAAANAMVSLVAAVLAGPPTRAPAPARRPRHGWLWAVTVSPKGDYSVAGGAGGGKDGCST